MRKLLLLLSVFFSSWLVTPASAAEIIRASTLPGSRMDGLNVINFSVNAPVARDYYAQFWLIPPQHPDGSYTVYQVFLNGTKVGEIRPDKGNWQSIRIKGDPALSLREGDNVISVATRAPELPQVESMRVVSSKSIEAFSSKEYDNFVKKAKREEAYPLPPEADIKVFPADLNSNQSENLGRYPLIYSFFSFFHFLEGQEIFISTTSASEHDFDLVYYCSDEQPPIIIPPIIIPGSENEINDMGIGDVTITDQKLQFTGIPATSLEKQGLNWKALSESNMALSIGQTIPSQIASMQLDIPQSGYYLLRVRTRRNGTTAVSNVNVNGDYYYSDVPISYTRRLTLFPANQPIITYAIAEGNANDPFLFIQGSDADRVVAYGDDLPANILATNFGLKSNDAFIEEEFQVETSAISVLNYWSQQPEGFCNMYYYGEHIPYLSVTFIQEKIDDPSISEKMSLEGPIGMDTGSTTIKVSAFDMAGNLINTVFLNAGEKISPQQVRISRPGFYFLRIESGSDVKTMKLKISS